jgi:hypothetical protein
MLDSSELLERDGIKIGAFGENTSDQPDGILHSAFFITSVRVAEVALDTERSVDRTVLSVFSSIVEGERFA